MSDEWDDDTKPNIKGENLLDSESEEADWNAGSRIDKRAGGAGGSSAPPLALVPPSAIADYDKAIEHKGPRWARGYVPQYTKRTGVTRTKLFQPDVAKGLETPVSFPGLSRTNNALVDVFGPESADQLLPARMHSLNPYVEDRSILPKKLRSVGLPDDDQFALAAAANDFRRPTFARQNLILGPLTKPRGDDAPLSRAERQALAAARKQQQLANQAAFWQADNAQQMYNAQRTVQNWNRLQKERARRNRMVIDRHTGDYTPIDDSYLQREAAMKNLARYLPGTITKPEYGDDLRALRGTYMNDAAYKRLGFDENLSGVSWRRLDPEVRKQKLAQFAELIGMFNLKPRRDERLTHVESAKTVYNEADYNIELQDLDDNPGTPGMVVITTRNNQTDRNGNVIPAGTIVAVDGWVVSPQTQTQHLKRLQNMLFFGRHPTKSSRQGQNRRLWNAINFGIPSELKPTKQNFKWLADVIKDMLLAGGKFLPGPQATGDGSTRDTPAVLVLGTGLSEANKEAKEASLVNGAVFRISTPVFNNFLSRVAELVFNMSIAAEMYRLTSQEGVNLSIAVRAFRASYDGSANMYEPEWGEYGAMIGAKVGGTKTGNDTYVNMWTRRVALSGGETKLGNIYAFWNSSYYHPRALGKFFQDEQFKALFETAVETFKSCSYRHAIVKLCMHQILLCTMNSNLPSVVDNVVGRAVDERDMSAYYSREPFITLLDVNQINSIRNSINRIPPVSAKNWDNEIRGIYDISLRGEGFVPQNEARNQQLQALSSATTPSWAQFYPAGDSKATFTPINFHRNGLAA